MSETVLSICNTCRDRDKENLKKRGGQRLIENIVAYFKDKKLPFLKLREVRCMSQCKRSCVVSFTSKNCFNVNTFDWRQQKSVHINNCFGRQKQILKSKVFVDVTNLFFWRQNKFLTQTLIKPFSISVWQCYTQ